MATLHPKEVEALMGGEHGAPFHVLGMHPLGEGGRGVVVRALQPRAARVTALDPARGREFPMKNVGAGGLFEAVLDGEKPFDYRFRVEREDGRVAVERDPYSFPLQLTDYDIYLYGEGTHYRTYEKMGAHPRTVNGAEGVHFAVWAPNAIRVSVVGDFNGWNGLHHPMQQRGGTGLWELFLPDLSVGALYKFEIRGPNGFLAVKSDPYAFASERRPKSASVVWDIHGYEWSDGDWMRRRREIPWHERPINVYEVHLGSWKRGEGNRWLTYRELADDLVPYAVEHGFTHLELLPVSEHPFDGSWGYQTLGYYSITSRFGTPDDFKHFVDVCHRNGIGVILDWVPAHFPKDEHGLAYFDGTHLYEHADPRKGEHTDWGTLIFNYGRNEVRTFLLSNAVFLAEVYHIDGLRVDAVASMLYLDYSRKEGEWVPNEFGGRENLEAVDFLKTFNTIIHGEYPGILTFAEESTSWPMVSRPTYLGGLGFGFKWNMGWMHDTLEYFQKDPIHRKYHHGTITFSMIYAYNENFILPFSHDEVVHGKRAMAAKMPGDDWRKIANLRLLYCFMAAHPGKKLLFMGCEFGPWKEWDCERSLEWELVDIEPHRSLRVLVRALNRLILDTPALHEVDFDPVGFEWIDYHDSEQSTLAFLRRAKDPSDAVVCVFNMTPVPREKYRLGVPRAGGWREVINSDDAAFGGSGRINEGILRAEEHPWQSQPCSLSLTLPPLGGILLAPVE
jgi:1,4-alpha-glucan branching enzyme